MPFVYDRVIRFHETDAAGVVYFARLLVLCHEAYEAALATVNIDLQAFFSEAGGVAVPIVHTEADFYQPLRCGDAIAVILVPKRLSLHSFEITYTISSQPLAGNPPDKTSQKPLAWALTRHVCTNLRSRRRQPLTPDLVDWIEAVNALAEPVD
ncbi:MAG: thioesterase family protein [Phormidesmis sp.]